MRFLTDPKKKTQLDYLFDVDVNRHEKDITPFPLTELWVRGLTANICLSA